VGNDSCCNSPIVTGGTYRRSYDGLTYTDQSFPATVTSFRLDRYEVTVARFRKFVNAWVAGYRPAAGAGKHAHLNSGSGLAATGGGYETGWDKTWETNIAATAAAWDANLSCDPNGQTWSSALGGGEVRPINCITWWEAHAFCIWDGGFLPTEAEWNYASTGGSDQRVYPWASPTIDENYAVYCGNSCNNVQPVGSKPAGDGKYGQSDLTGNVSEWNLDMWSASYTNPCNDCVQLAPDPSRVRRGGRYGNDASRLISSIRFSEVPQFRFAGIGARCARSP
jgi:formylglycine-generating enzyme required for sulfatase activity